MWTPDKKVGDEVAVWGGMYSREYRIQKIRRETATQYVLGDGYDTRISKKNGRVIGGSGWAEDYTDDVRRVIAEKMEKERLNSEAHRVLRFVEGMYYRNKQSGREWLVKHIGPLLPKEGE